MKLKNDQNILPMWFAITCICVFLGIIVYFISLIKYGITRDFNNWVDKKVEARAISMANEISAKHLQSEVEILAHKYVDSLLSQPIIFPAYAEKVKGNSDPQFMKEKGTYVERHMMVEATAYWVMDPEEASGDGIAYDGTPAIPYKTIAVDPDVIPLQSEVYVPGIGWCRANDTGNAINGRIIDISMPNRAEAWEWGRKLVYIKIRERLKKNGNNAN